VEAVDTTAAGDTFTGFFVAAIADGIDVKTALEQATKAAAISVSRKGAAPSIPTREEMLAF
jgi:ribokinase